MTAPATKIANQLSVLALMDLKRNTVHAKKRNGKIDEESSKLTAFHTPWGRYRWLQMS